MTSPMNANSARRRAVLLGVALAAAGLGAGLAGMPQMVDEAAWRLDPSRPDVTLDDVEREVVLRYRAPDISVGSLELALQKSAVAIFDVRTAAEYESGHIPGAIRVDPETTAAGFLAVHGELLRHRPAVFYCAVGVRSSRMMNRLVRDVAPSAKAGVLNLRGGAFRWVAEGRQLVAGARPGELHPFDPDWEQLLKRTLAAR
jgi:rhodanese-related sulfurtransferase